MQCKKPTTSLKTDCLRSANIVSVCLTDEHQCQSVGQLSISCVLNGLATGGGGTADIRGRTKK